MPLQLLLPQRPGEPLWIAGTGPAVLSIVLGFVAAAYFFITPTDSLAVDQLPESLQLVVYVIVNCVAVLLFETLNRQRSLAEANAHLRTSG